MPVYVDAMFPTLQTHRWPYKRACHMIADTVGELFTMAAKIGVKYEWCQGRRDPRARPHFDLTASKRKLAVQAGAVQLDRKDFITKLLQKRMET